MHETTQLCIRQLRKYVNSSSDILDVGTGSGILGIAALKLGAHHVFGTDLDENAITAVGENLAVSYTHLFGRQQRNQGNGRVCARYGARRAVQLDSGAS